jgi:hypothetical protein
MAFKFEQLKVWQKALDLTAEVNTLTKTFPEEELYILTSQIKRATDSIALNIERDLPDKVIPSLESLLVIRFVQALRLLGAFILQKEET